MGVVLLIGLALLSLIILGKCSVLVDGTFDNREERRNAD